MLPFTIPRRTDLAAMLQLAVPVVVVQIGIMLLGVVDTMVVGHFSSEALAAVALGHVGIMAVYSFVLGVLLVVDPLVAQALGAGDRTAARRAVQRGLLIAAGLMVPSAVLLANTETILTALRQPPEIVPISALYIRICIPGLLPYYAFIVLRFALQALGRLRPIVITIVAVNLFNAVADWLLVFGVGPFPELGPEGSAWATTAARTLLLAGLVAIAHRDLGPLLRPFERSLLDWRPLWHTFRLGLPIGFQMQLEMVAFAIIALLMGGLGAVQMAAHQVTINLASLTFMVPLGVAQATSIRVGLAIGAGDSDGARRAASSGLLIGAGFMSVTAAAFIAAPEIFAAAYTSAADVAALAVVLIPIAGFFQIFDGLQVVAAGALRGSGDTRAPLLVNLIGFWGIGLPVSLVLAFRLDLGSQGLWWGLVVGLGAVAAFLLARIAWRFRGEIARLAVG